MKKPFWIGLVIGWAVILFGIRGVFMEATRTHPGDFALWFFGSAIVHDALVAPVVFLAAVILARLVPGRIRPTIQTALVVAAPVVVMSIPLVLGRGGAPGNPSALPRNYLAGLLIVLAAIGAVTALALLRLARRPEDRPPA